MAKAKYQKPQMKVVDLEVTAALMLENTSIDMGGTGNTRAKGWVFVDA